MLTQISRQVYVDGGVPEVSAASALLGEEAVVGFSRRFRSRLRGPIPLTSRLNLKINVFVYSDCFARILWTERLDYRTRRKICYNCLKLVAKRVQGLFLKLEILTRHFDGISFL